IASRLMYTVTVMIWAWLHTRVTNGRQGRDAALAFCAQTHQRSKNPLLFSTLLHFITFYYIFMLRLLSLKQIPASWIDDFSQYHPFRCPIPKTSPLTTAPDPTLPGPKNSAFITVLAPTLAGHKNSAFITVLAPHFRVTKTQLLSLFLAPHSPVLLGPSHLGHKKTQLLSLF